MPDPPKWRPDLPPVRHPRDRRRVGSAVAALRGSAYAPSGSPPARGPFLCPRVHGGSAADVGSFTITHTIWRTNQQHRTADQRPHSRPRSPARRTRRGAGGDRPHRRRPAPGARVRARSRRGRTHGPAPGGQAHGLRQVQVRERAEGAGEPP